MWRCRSIFTLGACLPRATLLSCKSQQPGWRSALLAGLIWPLLAVGDTSDVTITGAEVFTGSAPVTLEFPLSRGGDTGFDTFIGFRTEDGTAAAGTDFTAANGVLKIPAGDTSATIPVTVAANTASGSDQTLQMVLDGAAGVGPAPAPAAATS